MNALVTLNNLQSQINAITAKLGVDACMAHAERVYSEAFRSEPVRICDLLNGQSLSMEDYYTEFNSIVDELWIGLKSELYTISTGDTCPSLDSDSPDTEDPYYDSWAMDISFEQATWRENRDEWIKHNNLNASDFINETTEIVELCNYKGEGEGGFELYTESTAKLRVFVSKRESFNV